MTTTGKQNQFRVQLQDGSGYWRSKNWTYRTLAGARRAATFEIETMGRQARVVQVLGSRIVVK